MSSETTETRRNAHTSLDQFSDAQIAVIGSALTGLIGLLGTSSEAPHQIGSKPAVNASPLPPETNGTVETRLEEALESEDLQTIRAHISSCLETIRSEKASAPVTPPLQVPRPILEDVTTGLPARLICERTITGAIAEGKESIVAVFVVERLAYINKRFGRSMGDDILLYVAQYLAQELVDSSSLCRWSGPAFAVVLNSYNAARKTEMQIRAISRKQLSKTIDSGGRSVMLPISCSCMVETISPESSPELIFSKMDEFIASHVTE